MREEVMDTLREWYPKYLTLGDEVLELGSRDVYGGVPRTIFADGLHHYVGVDMIAGAGVDVVANFYDLEQTMSAASLDTLLCFETFEHDREFWRTLDQVSRLLKPGGLWVCSVPTLGYPKYHPNPKDYYRFSVDAFVEVIMNPARYDAIETRELFTNGQSDGIIGLGRRR